MQPETHHVGAVVNPANLAKFGKKAGTFAALCDETRAAVDTATAAHHLNRRPQTLRAWACLENGPIRPFRVHGRLMWPTAALRQLCEVAK